ncbi:hypothetical protein [Parvicella tangerina]|uniref:Small multi-drug export protein n=1 Tax=Parvicella tangerina TaxID=2829795 RepID=A0A916JNE4_9FLAO|nr:hypothetical protein [Parvicella tangerina]CAG5083620.1 hypothetical protein CRYO30217_02246 [Parvicella tangerina]
MYWDVFLWSFFLGIVKFLFVPTIIYGWYKDLDLSHWDVLLPMIAGALFGFNLFYWFAEYFMLRAKEKRLKAILAGKKKRKRNFTRLNKLVVRISRSKMGLYVLSSVGLMFMSIPIGAIVIAKFYGNKSSAYLIANATIIVVAIALTFGNKLIFAL